MGNGWKVARELSDYTNWDFLNGLSIKACFSWYWLHFLDAQAECRKHEPKGYLVNKGCGL